MKLRTFSLRFLKGQKKHTIISVIAIALSVALMTMLLSAISVFMASSLRSAEKEYGSYHVIFSNLTKEELVKVMNMDIFESAENYSSSIYTSSTEAYASEMINTYSDRYYLLRDGNIINDVFLRIRPGELTMLSEDVLALNEGRLPENDGEIVISNASAFMWGYPSVGDQVSARLISCNDKNGEGIEAADVPEVLEASFDITGDEIVTFTVVGLSDKVNIVPYGDTRLRSYSTAYNNLVCRFSDKANDLYWDLAHSFTAVGMEIDDVDYAFNQQLLDLEGKGVSAKFHRALLFAVFYLAVIFIMFCVRLVIDSAFEISAKERIKQFGLLKAIGASRKQVLGLTLWEALYLAIPGIIIGTALGTALTAMLFGLIKGMSAMEDGGISQIMVYDVRPYVYISAVVMGILWVLISAVATGMRSIRSTPVEALRSAGRKEKIIGSKRRSGIEKGKSFVGAYSALSITRNRKRYIVTMASMVLSITLFSCFSYGIELAKQAVRGDYQDNVSWDYLVDHQSASQVASANDAYFMSLEDCFENVRWDSSIQIISSASALGLPADDPMFAEDVVVLEVHPINYNDFMNNIGMNGSFDYDELTGSGKILLPNVTYDPENNREIPLFGDGFAEVMQGAIFFPNLFKAGFMTEFETAGVYSTDIQILRSEGLYLKAVMTEEAYLNKVSELGFDSFAQDITYGDGQTYTNFVRQVYADAKEGHEEEALNYLNRHFVDSYTDCAGELKKAEGNISVAAAVGYMVIGIISIIAAVNIINIISANVLNRTAELSMLRACGMSDKQLYSLIFREGFLYAASAGIISLIITEIGVIAMKLPFIIRIEDLNVEDLAFTIDPLAPLKYFLIAIPAAFIIAAAASWFPARRIISSSVVENIRSEENM